MTATFTRLPFAATLEWPDGVSGEDGEGGERVRVSPVLGLVVERLPGVPAMVFSCSGEVLLQTGTAIALFGDVNGLPVRALLDLRRPGCHRQLLVDAVDGQVLLAFIPM